jgi:hypothetical protein
MARYRRAGFGFRDPEHVFQVAWNDIVTNGGARKTSTSSRSQCSTDPGLIAELGTTTFPDAGTDGSIRSLQRESAANSPWIHSDSRRYSPHEMRYRRATVVVDDWHGEFGSHDEWARLGPQPLIGRLPY